MLRNALPRDALATKKMPASHRLAITIKAWNAYREGRSIGYLRFAGGGAKPEQFPEPR